MTWDKNWEKFYKNFSGNRYPEPILIRLIAKNFFRIKKRKKIKILDLGCGEGANLWFLAREGFDAYGIDGSKTVIDRAQKLIKKENLKAKLVLGDFRNLPYEGMSFDAVIDMASLQHNDDDSVKIVLDEIIRILKPGGRYFGMVIEKHFKLSDTNFKTNFMNKRKIKSAFKHFKDLSIDKAFYTEENEKRNIQFSIIEACK